VGAQWRVRKKERSWARAVFRLLPWGEIDQAPGTKHVTSGQEKLSTS
jgi:hypothetical protein